MAGGADSTIVVQAQRGDMTAYESLAQDVATRLYPVALRIVRDRDLADEALQRTLVAIWRELPKLRDPAKFQAWSYRLLVRFCTNELRRQQRLADRGAEFETIPARGDETARIADRDELERAFSQLSGEHRAVIVLVYYRGLSGPAAASTLGVSPGTVASRLHYALRHMRAALEADRRQPLVPQTALASAVSRP